MILKQEGFEVVAEAGNGSEAVQLVCEHEPDIVLLDISMPGVDGLDALRRISDLRLSVKILILTSLLPMFFSFRCMRAGASGYVSKADDLSDLTKAINAIKSGYTFFPDLTTSSVRGDDGLGSEISLIQSLSDRELSILQQLAKGLTNKQIGEKMLISNNVVSSYKSRLIEKLNVSSLVNLSEIATRNYLI